MHPVSFERWSRIVDWAIAKPYMNISKAHYELGLDNVIDEMGNIVCLDKDWATFKEEHGS